MKLITSIPPRLDGTVLVLGSARDRNYSFEANADGELECDVSDNADLAALLATNNFHPADEADFEAALMLTGAAAGSLDDTAIAQVGGEAVNQDAALPVESETPPQPATKKVRKVAAD